MKENSIWKVALMVGLILVGGTLGLYADPEPLEIKQMLLDTERNSPDLRALVYREVEAGESAREVDSGFYPTLDAAVVDSSGFPGSASGLDGFSGLVASPYRKGPAVDAFSKWDLVDLSQWDQSAAAHAESDAARKKTALGTALLDSRALGAYLDTVRLKGDRDAWQRLADELGDVQKIVDHFIRNGQYSEVQGALIQDQLSDAQMKAADFDRQYQAGLSRLALLTGLKEGDFSCPDPGDLAEGEIEAPPVSGESPLVARARLEYEASRESVSRYSDENLPKLELGGSAGFLQDTRLEPSQDYSVFVGVTLPVFEGFRIDAEEKAARAEAQARNAEVDSARLTLEDLNVGYQASIDRARGELVVLGEEQARAGQAVKSAKERYLSFLGPLSDLQQALKDMVNIDLEMGDMKTQLLAAQGGFYFLNGGTVDGLK